LSLESLVEQPFQLLLELERMARAAAAGGSARESATEDWVGIGFRLGTENFVASRSDVREVLPVPDQVTRVPGAKPWLRGITNVRGQLLTVVDLKAFLGSAPAMTNRHARMLMAASRDVPVALIVDEVSGFRRFSEDDYDDQPVATVIRCERYIDGCFRRGTDAWPRFSLTSLLEDDQFQNAGQQLQA
jgi:twitching motility protein PilI